jgi:hypothetical protein
MHHRVCVFGDMKNIGEPATAPFRECLAFPDLTKSKVPKEINHSARYLFLDSQSFTGTLSPIFAMICPNSQGFTALRRISGNTCAFTMHRPQP